MAEVDMKEIKSKVSKGLEVARWKLLEKHPFIGEMLLRFSIIPTYDKYCLTAATDGSKIYFDCEFYSKLTPGQREFVLAHEVWHNIFLHFIRRHARDPEVWNVATDMEINHMIQNEGMECLKDGCYPPPVVAGKNAEDIYAWLQKQMKQNQKNKQSQNGQGQGQGQGDGESNDSQCGTSGGPSSSSSSKGGKKGNQKSSGNAAQNQNNAGNNKGQYGNQFDKHIYEGEGKGQNGDEGGQNGKFGPRGNDPDFQPSMEDARETENRIKEMVTSVAQSIERKQGHLPAGVASMVEKMLKPEINWKEALSQFVTKTLGGEHSWSRCSRHALGRGMYLPGKTDMKIKAGLILDTSGSYLQDLPKFLAEFKALVESFGKYEITLIQCDAAVQDVKTYDAETSMEFDKFEVKGGGGSDFRPAFKKLRELGDDFNCVITFTDSYIDVPKYPPPYPALWVLTPDANRDFCDWGEKMVYKPDYREED